eukprot:m.871621 g.871621  ORF g.871621 m.871621 type:complete len:284 (-) comp59764_c0_seq3:259-1110(-)
MMDACVHSVRMSTSMTKSSSSSSYSTGITFAAANSFVCRFSTLWTIPKAPSPRSPSTFHSVSGSRPRVMCRNTWLRSFFFLLSRRANSDAILVSPRRLLYVSRRACVWSRCSPARQQPKTGGGNRPIKPPPVAAHTQHTKQHKAQTQHNTPQDTAHKAHSDLEQLRLVPGPCLLLLEVLVVDGINVEGSEERWTGEALNRHAKARAVIALELEANKLLALLAERRSPGVAGKPGRGRRPSVPRQHLALGNHQQLKQMAIWIREGECRPGRPEHLAVHLVLGQV